MPKFDLNKVCETLLMKSLFGMGVRSRVKLLYIFRTPLYKRTYGGLLLKFYFPKSHSV